MRLALLFAAFIALATPQTALAQVSIDPGGSVTLGTPGLNPPTTTTLNGDTEVTGELSIRGGAVGVVLSDVQTENKTAEVTCTGGATIVSGGGFYIIPDNKGGKSNAQGLCGYGIVQCKAGKASCKIEPKVTQGCNSPDKDRSIAMVQAVCR